MLFLPDFRDFHANTSFTFFQNKFQKINDFKQNKKNETYFQVFFRKKSFSYSYGNPGNPVKRAKSGSFIFKYFIIIILLHSVMINIIILYIIFTIFLSRTLIRETRMRIKNSYFGLFKNTFFLFIFNIISFYF